MPPTRQNKKGPLMTTKPELMKHLDHLPLTRLGPAREAGLWTVSLPLPRHAPTALTAGHGPAHVKLVGQWHDVAESSSRRLLITAQATEGMAPKVLSVSDECVAAQGKMPLTQTVLIDQSPNPLFVWESHALELQRAGTRVELAMGLRTGDGVLWWEATRLVVLEETAHCRIVEMAGAIPRVRNSRLEREWVITPKSTNPILHQHDWLNGHMVVRLHANGVCEVLAHHINSKFYDDGLPLADAVPVLGIRVNGGEARETDACGVWDGTEPLQHLGPVRFDFSDAAHLASSAQPGKMTLAGDGFLVWQPYTGMELYGGQFSTEQGGDGYFFHAEETIIPRGMARTLRFSFSLAPDISPSIARYLPPAWWFSVCEEFSPAPLLPVSNEYDASLIAHREWLQASMMRDGYEDGAIPRSAAVNTITDRGESGWEGEVPYGHFLSAWRTGSSSQYDDAMRQSYYFTDVCIDHAAKQVRMHGYPPNTFALPMARVLSCVAAYLETGDAYLIDTAKAVIETAHWTHKNSWPRLAVGRDASYLRGAVMLYRYFADNHFREIAEQGIADVIQSQRDDGSFGDQGGGTGVHQYGSYIAKPWMGLIAVSGIIDYLEIFPANEAMFNCVKRFADWLMAERFLRKGAYGWAYQHLYNGGNEALDYRTGKGVPVKKEGSPFWHVEYLARLLMFCTLRTRDAAYLQAWEESYHAYHAEGIKVWGDHGTSQTFQYLPWLQDRLWRVQLTESGLLSQPVFFGEATPATGTVQSPAGPVELRWTEGGASCSASGDVRFMMESEDEEQDA